MGKPYAKCMPFSDDFWKSPEKSYIAPQGLRGFICSLPLLWTNGENNHPGFNMVLLTQNEPHQSDTAVANANSGNSNGVSNAS